MQRHVACVLLVVAVGCKKHEDALTATPEPPSTTITASTAPSTTASVATLTALASATPSASAATSAAPRRSAEFGIIGLLNTGGSADPNAPTAPWGREDTMSARGNMWGDTIGDSFGAGGLGLPDGGGGMGGIGLGHGRLGGGGGSHGRLRQGQISVNGRLPPEVVQRIVRQNFGRFRLCYANGLRTNPSLAGTVSTKFIIDRAGAVASVGSDAQTDLPDATVADCVRRGFSNLTFPQPEGGIVTVIFPLRFDPGD